MTAEDHEAAIVEDTLRELAMRGLNDPLAYRAYAMLRHEQLSLTQCLCILAKAALDQRDAALKLAKDAIACAPVSFVLENSPELMRWRFSADR